MCTRVVLAGKSQTTWRTMRGNFAATTSLASKPMETSVLGSKNIHEETKT